MVLRDIEKKKIKQLKFFKKNSVSMRLAADAWDNDWKTLVAIMMSAQSRDEVTIVIAEKLFKKFNTLSKLANADYASVLKILQSLNYNKTKSKHIISCANILVNEYNMVVPHDFELLTALPGVGRKTANVFLAEFGGETIGVDTHVEYISTKMGWTKNIAQKRIENDLKKAFPKKYWGSLNNILVGFGKSHTNKKEKDALILEAKKIK
jgi:endonuclease III